MSHTPLFPSRPQVVEAILPRALAESIARKAGYRLALDPATGSDVVCHPLHGERFTGSRAWARAAAAVVVEGMR